jgi:tetratricopeptide (TPR) repeat protein
MTVLRQTYPASTLKKVYGLSEGKTAALAAALGTTDEQLAAAFTAWADARLAAHQNELDFRAAEAEAQRKQAAGDWPGMVAALRKALKLKPGDPQTLFNLGSAQMRAGDLAGAEASLKKILAASLPSGEQRFISFGHYQLGRVYDLAGRRGEALAEYDAVLALPDDHGVHAMAKERKSSPATRDQLE